MRRLLVIAAIVLGAGVAQAQPVGDLRSGPFEQEKNLQRAFGVPGTPQVVSTSTTSARNGTDIAARALVRVVCQDASVYFKLGNSSVTATSETDNYLPADAIEWFNVGTNVRIAFVTKSGTGKCYITTMATVIGGSN